MLRRTEFHWETVPHKLQRYETCGDYFWITPDYLSILVSKLSDPRYEMLIAYHEQTEALILRHQGIAEEDVTAFDMAYEECRRLKVKAPCGCEIQEEPGNDRHAPYHMAHSNATVNEMTLAMSLGVDWDAYAKEVESLSKGVNDG